MILNIPFAIVITPLDIRLDNPIRSTSLDILYNKYLFRVTFSLIHEALSPKKSRFR